MVGAVTAEKRCHSRIEEHARIARAFLFVSICYTREGTRENVSRLVTLQVGTNNHRLWYIRPHSVGVSSQSVTP